MTEKYRAIPDGYMTVGQAARRMGVTVRTLQYYDREGLLSPSAESEGGRRLYTHKDLLMLHQIISLKSLGFSLNDIKNRLVTLETPADVERALAEQASGIEEKIRQLNDSLSAIEQLRREVMQMQTVDFKKYADIIVNLRINNEFYFLIKYFDDDTLEHIRNKFDEESGKAFIRRFSSISERILELQKNDVPQDSDQCQSLTKEFWDMVTEFTGGDMTMLPKLIELGSFESGEKNEWQEKQAAVNSYIAPALEIYLSRLGIDPFAGTENQQAEK